MRTSENSEDPDEIMHDAAFQPYIHLHYLQETIHSLHTTYNLIWKL